MPRHWPRKPISARLVRSDLERPCCARACTQGVRHTEPRKTCSRVRGICNSAIMKREFVQPCAGQNSEFTQTHETRKRLEYEERIVNVDHGSFTPLAFSSTGPAGPMADTFLQRLAGKLSEKDGVSYSSTIAWLHSRFSFALLRGSILCIRGSRSRKRCPTHPSERELAIVESRLDLH